MPAWRRWALIAGAGVLLLVLGFAFGRYAQPPRVEIQERVKVEQVEHQVVVTQEKVRVERVEVAAAAQASHRVETTVRRPDGTQETQVVEDRSSERVAEQASTAASDRATAVEHSVATTATSERRERHEAAAPPAWLVTGMVGLEAKNVTAGLLRPVYGVQVQRRVLGPVSAGVWGLSSGVVGVSVSLAW